MYCAIALFTPYTKNAVEVVRGESPELACRVFAGVMGYVPTDMGQPGLLGAVWHKPETGTAVGAEYDEEEDFEERHRGLEMIGESVSEKLAGQPVAVLCVRCFGGWDYCKAVVFHWGIKALEREVWQNPDAYAIAIGESVGMLGVSLKDGYFPPFARDAFERFGKACD